MKLYRKQHIVQYPRNTKNLHIKELIRQNETFREFVTPAGHTQYRASGRNDHDDLTMSQMLALHLARRFIRIGKISHVGGRLSKREEEAFIFA